MVSPISTRRGYNEFEFPEKRLGKKQISISILKDHRPYNRSLALKSLKKYEGDRVYVQSEQIVIFESREEKSRKKRDVKEEPSY